MPISILGVNEVGYEASNDQMTDGRDLPWLQETGSDSVWRDWNVVYRDLIVIGDENQWLMTHNLTRHDLEEEAELDFLRTALLELAQ